MLRIQANRANDNTDRTTRLEKMFKCTRQYIYMKIYGREHSALEFRRIPYL